MTTVVLFIGLMGSDPLGSVDRAAHIPAASLVDRARRQIKAPAPVNNLRGVVRP